MSLSLVLSVCASVIHLVAFGTYNIQLKDPTFKPTAATWTLWVVLTTANFAAYLSASNDWVKSLVPAVNSAACVLTFFLALARGKFGRLSMTDNAALIIGSVAIFVWWWCQSATYANLLLQGAIAVSFIPTYRTVWNEPHAEKARPWALWGSAYIFLTMVVILRWNGRWQDLVYPVQGAIMHGAVVPLTWRKP